MQQVLFSHSWQENKTNAMIWIDTLKPERPWSEQNKINDADIQMNVHFP